MEDGMIRITPDKERAKSILKMAETTMEMLGCIDRRRFASNLIKEYYEIIRELSSIIMLIDGYKLAGDDRHKRLVDYLKDNYQEFTAFETSLMDELRILRNKIAYDGFFVTEDFVDRKQKHILRVIEKLRRLIRDKM